MTLKLEGSFDFLEGFQVSAIHEVQPCDCRLLRRPRAFAFGNENPSDRALSHSVLEDVFRRRI